MKLGLITASASRQAGGLFWAARSLAEQLQQAGCNVHVFAGRDRHSDEDRPLWGQTPVHEFDRVGPEGFGYTLGLRAGLISGSLDLLHTHGLWMYPSVATRRWGRKTGQPWLVSPHGMLDPWALQNARWKKRVAGLIYENRHLRAAACLHALCDAEANAMRAYGLTNPIAVIPNGVELPQQSVGVSETEWERSLPKSAKVLLFLGRLHPKKGLSNLLRAWSRERRATQDQWVLAIAGWDENDHQKELEALAGSLGIGGTVRFIGPQFGSAKAACFDRANAFVLPSFSEGLPMAVLEAWAYGLPVLMTAQCNLPEGIDADAAVLMKPEVESIREALRILFGMRREEIELMGKRGLGLVEERFSWETIATEMASVYEWVLGCAPMPDCVRLQ